MPELARVTSLCFLGCLMARPARRLGAFGTVGNPGRGPGAEVLEDARSRECRAGGDATGLRAAADDLVDGAGGVLLDIPGGRGGHQEVPEVAGGLVDDVDVVVAVVNGHVIAKRTDVQQ